MSLTPTFSLPYISLQGCSGWPACTQTAAYKHPLSGPIHAHVVPVQYIHTRTLFAVRGHIYGVTQGWPGPRDPRISQCQPKIINQVPFCQSLTTAISNAISACVLYHNHLLLANWRVVQTCKPSLPVHSVNWPMTGPEHLSIPDCLTWADCQA